MNHLHLPKYEEIRWFYKVYDAHGFTAVSLYHPYEFPIHLWRLHIFLPLPWFKVLNIWYDSWVENWGSHGIIGTDRPRMPWRSGKNSVLWLANHLRGTAGSMSSLILRLTDVKRNMPSSLMRARCCPLVRFWLLRVLIQRRLARNRSSAALWRRTCWAVRYSTFPFLSSHASCLFWSCGVRS